MDEYGIIRDQDCRQICSLPLGLRWSEERRRALNGVIFALWAGTSRSREYGVGRGTASRPKYFPRSRPWFIYLRRARSPWEHPGESHSPINGDKISYRVSNVHIAYPQPGFPFLWYVIEYDISLVVLNKTLNINVGPL